MNEIKRGITEKIIDTALSINKIWIKLSILRLIKLVDPSNKNSFIPNADGVIPIRLEKTEIELE